MAGLRDSNGQIVIDEASAEADVKKIQEALSKLAEARQALEPSKLDDNRMRGETLDALKETLRKLLQDIKERETQCNTMIKFIRAVVVKYKNIDREYARKAAGHSGGGFSGGGRSHGGGNRSF